jgi:hypothetical protein
MLKILKLFSRISGRISIKVGVNHPWGEGNSTLFEKDHKWGENGLISNS